MDVQINVPNRATPPGTIPQLFPVARFRLTITHTGTPSLSLDGTTITIPAPGDPSQLTPLPNGDLVFASAVAGSFTIDMRLDSDFNLATDGYSATESPTSHPRTITFVLNGVTISAYRFSGYSIPSAFNKNSPSRRLNFNPPTITFNPALPGGTVVERHPIDVILILDRSGSMFSSVPAGLPGAGLPKIDALKNAIDQFISTWTLEATQVADDRLGLIWFDTTATRIPVGSPAVDLALRAQWNLIAAEVNAGTPTGITALGDGITEAFEIQEGTVPQNPDTVFLLMSDGMQNAGNQIQEAVPSVPNIPGGPDDPSRLSFFDTNVGDWRELSDKAIATQAIGVGANGTGGTTWEELLDEISTETGGRADMTWPNALDIAYTNQLVEVMKGNTLSKVLQRIAVLPNNVNSSGRIEFEIDSSVRQFIVILDWRNSNFESALRFSLFEPDGSQTEGPGRSGAFYREEAIDLEGRARGTWSVEVFSNIIGVARLSADIEYHLTVLVAEGEFAYDIQFANKKINTGDPIDLGVTVSRDGVPVGGLGGSITVDVEAPGGALGTFLHQNDVPDAVLKSNPPGSDPDAFPTAAARKLNFLLEEGNLRSIIMPRGAERIALQESTTTGLYTMRYTRTSTPGIYKFTVRIEDTSGGEPIVRVEEHNVTVAIRTVSSDQSQIIATALQGGGYSVSMVLRDRFGNVLAPDHQHQFRILLDGNPIEARIDDQRANGTYGTVLTQIPPGANPRFTLQFKGNTVVNAPIDSLKDGGTKPSPEDWLRKLLALLIRLLLWIIRFIQRLLRPRP